MSSKKEDILKAAEHLFYEYGFKGVGIKQIIQEADVANMTLYNHFSSKEQLVEEVLKQREKRYWSYLDRFTEEETVSPYLNAVKAHGMWLEEESYQGDMFLRAIEDYAGANNEIEHIARSHKQNLLTYFTKLAQRVEKDTHEEDLPHYFTLLLEGTTSMTTLIGAKKATEYALKIAEKMVSS
ncbi:TetR/AcrR family transcriptional regulator [Bacillus sp. JCM 19041]|uniref:TetR/AcrR family transcriptional regulator n=1 Tax=Bacillus sp. JCM 19041 TaxID=1460637 RepID=UPI0006CF7A25